MSVESRGLNELDDHEIEHFCFDNTLGSTGDSLRQSLQQRDVLFPVNRNSLILTPTIRGSDIGRNSFNLGGLKSSGGFDSGRNSLLVMGHNARSSEVRLRDSPIGLDLEDSQVGF